MGLDLHFPPQLVLHARALQLRLEQHLERGWKGGDRVGLGWFGVLAAACAARCPSAQAQRVPFPHTPRTPSVPSCAP